MEWLNEPIPEPYLTMFPYLFGAMFLGIIAYFLLRTPLLVRKECMVIAKRFKCQANEMAVKMAYNTVLGLEYKNKMCKEIDALYNLSNEFRQKATKTQWL